MDAEKLNDIRQALSGAYSREIDRIIRKEVKDKSRADNLKRIMDNLPIIEPDDQPTVDLLLEEHLARIERAMEKHRVKPEREDTITMELMGIVTHMERLADDAERLLRSLPDDVLPWNWSAGLGDLNQGIAWLDDLAETVADTEAGEQKPDID